MRRIKQLLTIRFGAGASARSIVHVSQRWVSTLISAAIH